MPAMNYFGLIFGLRCGQFQVEVWLWRIIVKIHTSNDLDWLQEHTGTGRLLQEAPRHSRSIDGLIFRVPRHLWTLVHYGNLVLSVEREMPDGGGVLG